MSSSSAACPTLPWDPPGPNTAHDQLPQTGTVDLFWSNGHVRHYRYEPIDIDPSHVKHYLLTERNSTETDMRQMTITRLYSHVRPWHDFVTNAGSGYNRCVTLLFNGTLPARMQIGATIAWNVK